MLTISAVAEHKGIQLQNLEVQIGRNSLDAEQIETHFSVDVILDESLTRRERILLFNSARKCDVSKLLEGKIDFDYQLKMINEQ